MMVAAVAVQGEAIGAFTVQQYQKRQALARAVFVNPDGYKQRFANAVAANTTVANGVGALVLITSSTNANPIVVTTSAAHGLAAADCIVIANHTINTNANGGWVVVSAPTTTTFSIGMNGNGVGLNTGTVRKNPPDADIQFTVNSVWDDLSGVDVLD